MKTYALSENQIRLQMLSTSTAIRAGKVSCVFDSEAATEACCDALENVKNRHVGYSVKANKFYCEYSDAGTGDWD